MPWLPCLTDLRPPSCLLRPSSRIIVCTHLPKEIQVVVKSAASVETTEQSQSTAAASRSTGPPGAPPHGRSDPDLHSTQKSPVASDSSRSTLDSAFKHSNTQGSRLRLKAEGPASPSLRKKWKTKNRASSRSPTPPTRTTPAESIGCFCRSAFCCFFFSLLLLLPLAAGARYTVVFEVQFPLPPHVLPRYSAAWCSADGTAWLRWPLPHGIRGYLEPLCATF